MPDELNLDYREIPNEEAITLLSELRSGYNLFDSKEQPYYSALSMAITALRFTDAYGELLKRYMNRR